jgi:hypothetical protein
MPDSPRANLPKVCEGQTDVLFAVDQMLSSIQEVTSTTA